LAEWVLHFNNHDVDSITSMYHENAILLPTFELICLTEDQIVTYFYNLLKKDRLRCDVAADFLNQSANDKACSISQNTVVSNGVYVFSFYENGKLVTQRARFTYVFHNNLIITHHSSVDPE
jgi:hypothetical protein